MISPLSIYSEGLCADASTRPQHRARLLDGTVVQLPLDRYLRPADAADEQVLAGLVGPVLDVGCGPGRHSRALAAQGVFAVGIDLSPVAVELAVGRGARALVGDIFEELPGSGSWRSALLLDGNIGIGGSPERLLRRIGRLLGPGGEVLVEFEPPGTLTCSTHARLEVGGVASAWFPWARVAAPEIGSVARAAGFRATEVWSVSGRWFGRLHRDDRHSRRLGADRNPIGRSAS
jgi:SAM-dependent methyltransferase